MIVETVRYERQKVYVKAYVRATRDLVSPIRRARIFRALERLLVGWCEREGHAFIHITDAWTSDDVNARMTEDDFIQGRRVVCLMGDAWQNVRPEHMSSLRHYMSTAWQIDFPVLRA